MCHFIKLCAFVLGSMTPLMLIIMGIGYKKTQIEVLIFCALYVLRVVHSLAVLKGHPECLKYEKTLFTAIPIPRSWWGWLAFPKNPTPALGPLGLQP